MQNASLLVIHKMRSRKPKVTVKGWAMKNGFKPDTVYKAIHGTRGGVRSNSESAKIITALKRDGFWPTPEEIAFISDTD